MTLTKNATVMMTNVKVEITTNDAFRVIANELGYVEGDGDYGYCILEANDKRNPCKTRGIFRWTDISYHGSPQLEYKLYESDPEKIQRFQVALKIKELMQGAGVL